MIYLIKIYSNLFISSFMHNYFMNLNYLILKKPSEKYFFPNFFILIINF